MIKKFKIFEQLNIDPYGEERWEDNTLPYIPYENEQNFDNWLLQIGVSNEDKNSLYDLYKKIMTCEDRGERRRILFDKFIPLINIIADNLNLFGEDKENFIGAMILGNNFKK
jgi:hypothetical protein